MGQYKVPQDVEAEDKILGPYTLKQFIYAVIGVAYGFLTFRIFFGTLPVLFFIIGVPPTVLMLMLGLYQRKDQPFEALFLALVSFWTKPRKRIWIKEPITEVFKIVQPPLKEDVTQKNPGEVRSQLEHLAQVIDARGSLPTYDEQGNAVADSPLLDLEERLIEPSLVAQRDIGAEPAPDPSLYSPKNAIIEETYEPVPTPAAVPSSGVGEVGEQSKDNTTLTEGQSVSIR